MLSDLMQGGASAGLAQQLRCLGVGGYLQLLGLLHIKF